MLTVKQGPAECYPAVCAALSGQLLADILRDAARAAGITDWHGRRGEWMERIWNNENLCTAAFDYLWKKYTPWLSRDFLMRGSNDYVIGGNRELPPGRGVVTFADYGLRHILPYADGLLYVSDDGKPDMMTLAEYVNLTKFRVENIVPESK